MVHLEIDAEDLPTHYRLLGIDVPDGIPVMALAENELPDGWRTQIAVTRARGDEWLRTGRAVLLPVPSVVVPEAANYLLNPAHVEAARISIASTLRAPFDRRLMAFVGA
jgi:RES domain-containing protein